MKLETCLKNANRHLKWRHKHSNSTFSKWKTQRALPTGTVFGDINEVINIFGWEGCIGACKPFGNQEKCNSRWKTFARALAGWKWIAEWTSVGHDNSLYDMEKYAKLRLANWYSMIPCGEKIFRGDVVAVPNEHEIIGNYFNVSTSNLCQKQITKETFPFFASIWFVVVFNGFFFSVRVYLCSKPTKTPSRASVIFSFVANFVFGLNVENNPLSFPIVMTGNLCVFLCFIGGIMKRKSMYNSCVRIY